MGASSGDWWAEKAETNLDPFIILPGAKSPFGKTLCVVSLLLNLD